MSSVGIMYCVVASSRVNQTNIKVGSYVLLNQRTFTIMETLDLRKEELMNAADKLAHLYQVPEKN